VRFSGGPAKLLSDTGELLFTSNGISGPLVLSLSGVVGDWLAQGRKISAHIDLKPALSRERLEKRLLRDLSSHPGKDIKNVLKALLPARFIEVFIGMAGIERSKKAAQINREERAGMLRLLKDLTLKVESTGPMEKAMITRGGVSLREIDPRTMESRVVKGLYFAGEVLDVDADTGGYNLQAAFSTGYLAGESAAHDA